LNVVNLLKHVIINATHVRSFQKQNFLYKVIFTDHHSLHFYFCNKGGKLLAQSRIGCKKIITIIINIIMSGTVCIIKHPVDLILLFNALRYYKLKM
jgi:hypothetical protein